MIVLTYAALVQIFCYLEWPQMELRLDKKPAPTPKSPNCGGDLGCSEFIFHCTDPAQILSDCCELVLNADTTSAVDAKIWM